MAQDICKDVADNTATAVAKVEGTGRIGTDKFDKIFFWCDVVGKKVFWMRKQFKRYTLPDRWLYMDINKSGTSNVDRFDCGCEFGVVEDSRLYLCCNLSRWFFKEFGKNHCRVAGKIAKRLWLVGIKLQRDCLHYLGREVKRFLDALFYFVAQCRKNIHKKPLKIPIHSGTDGSAEHVGEKGMFCNDWIVIPYAK